MGKTTRDSWPYKKIGPGIVLASFGFLVSVVTLGFDAYFGLNAYRQHVALNFSTTRGTITHSRTESERRERDRIEHHAVIKYSYSVAGKTYEGNRLRYGSGSANRSDASKIVQRHPVGKAVIVYHVPESARESLLYPGIEGSDYFAALCLCPFNLFPLGVVVLLSKRLRARLLRYEGPAARVYDDGVTLRVRLPPVAPSYVAAVVTGMVAFFAIFPIVFFYEVYPPKSLMQNLWLTVLGIAGVTYLIAGRWLAGSKYDLLVDVIAGKISLPVGCGRRRKVLLPLQQLKRLEIQRVGLPRSGDFFSAYRPTLVFVTGDGSHREERIAQWPVRQQAEALTAWLGERLKIDVLVSEKEVTSEGHPG